MKLVYCISGTFNSGGMERIIISKVNALSKLDFDICIVTTEQKGRVPFFPINPNVKSIDLGINYSDDKNKLILNKFFSFIKKKRKHRILLEIFLNKIQPDVVISTFGNEILFLHKIKCHAKKVLEIHFSKFFRTQYDRKGLWRIVDKIRTLQDEKIVLHYDKFVVLTKEDKKLWGDLKNITVIPNFLTKIPEKIAPLTNKKCLAVGRLSYQKGYDMMIRIWSIVHKYYNDWKLVIYGGGELREYLEKMIIEFNLSDSISIMEPIKQIEKEYLDSSIFLLSSRYEGLPMVLLEAMSYGLPPISYSCKCGPRDIIFDGYNGYLIDENNIVAFANKIIKLIENNNLRKQIGENAHKSIVKYSEQNIINEWVSLFKSL